ncbi:MAG: protein-export chaperone SecB [Pseudomonadota bacterium]
MAEENPAPNFRIHKVYVKDLSFESPRAPNLFVDNAGWQPKVQVQLNSESSKIKDQLFESVLTLTVTVQQGEETAYLVESKYAGLFELSGFPDPQLAQMLGAYCPNVLFPFARQLICDTVVAGGFPQLLLEPVNFDALFQQQQQQQQQVKEQSASETTLQ